MAETISVRRLGSLTGTKDLQGNPVRNIAATSDVVIRAFAPSVSDESGDTTISGGRIYADRGTVFELTDVLTIRGVEYQVDGEIGDWAALNDGGPDGIEVPVKRLT